MHILYTEYIKQTVKQTENEESPYMHVYVNSVRVISLEAAVFTQLIYYWVLKRLG